MRVATAQLPDLNNSDDRTFTTDNAVIMLDGASAFVPVPVAAATYADTLGREVRQRLTDDPAAELADALADAITDTANQLDLTPGESPSATVAIARVHAGHVDLLVLGDTQVALPSEIISDDRLSALGLTASQTYRDRLASGTGYDDEHRALLRELQTEQAKHRNRDGGYWIAEATPEAAHHAITTRRPAAEVPWLVLATDGAYKPMEHLGIASWEVVAQSTSAELFEILFRCWRWEEEQDPHGHDQPRAKRHDDKSLAAVSGA